jgi:hypothetical protein
MRGEPPTKKRPFDVGRYAEDAIGRERLPTIMDEAATEEARIASVLMDSNPPGGETKSSIPTVVYSELEALSAAEQLALLRARLAPMSRVPSLSRQLCELGPVIEDPKTAYVLGFVDGVLPLETIVDVAGIPEVDTLRILERAIDEQIMIFTKVHT